MERGITTLAAAVCLGVMGVPSGAVGADAACTHEQLEEVVRNGVAVVARGKGGSALYACAFSKNVFHPFDRDDIGPDLEIAHHLRPVLRGRFAAWEQRVCDGGGCEPGIGVIDAETGRVRDAFTFGGFVPTDVAVSPRGSAAWIEEIPDGRTGRLVPTVVKCERACMAGVRGRAGRRVVLDRGRRIRLQSLTLGGSTLSWINSGRRKRAGLH